MDNDCANPECPEVGRCGGECVRKWDEELAQRTNPETCLHNIVQQVFSYVDGNPWGPYFVICLSCNSTITYEFGQTKNYKYNPIDDIWVHMSIKKD